MLDRLYLVCAIGLLGLLGVAISFASIPHLSDFGEWLYQSQILLRKVTEPATVTTFSLATYPVPNSLATILLAVLGVVASPLWAGKLYLVLSLLGWCLVLWGFVKRYGPEGSRGATYAVLVSIGTLASYFWYGFISYQLALLIFLAFMVRWPRLESPMETAVFGVLLFFAHAMIFLVWGAWIGIAILQRQLDIRHLLAFYTQAIRDFGFQSPTI